MYCFSLFILSIDIVIERFLPLYLEQELLQQYGVYFQNVLQIHVAKLFFIEISHYTIYCFLILEVRISRGAPVYPF